jgi:hypothetical protein
LLHEHISLLCTNKHSLWFLLESFFFSIIVFLSLPQFHIPNNLFLNLYFIKLNQLLLSVLSSD